MISKQTMSEAIDTIRSWGRDNGQDEDWFEIVELFARLSFVPGSKAWKDVMCELASECKMRLK